MKTISVSVGMLLFLSIIFGDALANTTPTQPVEPLHPGSAAYEFTSEKNSFQISQRTVDVFVPKEIRDSGRKAPVIVFGHGQALGLDVYETTFQHLARKGVVVVFPQFDTGFFDRDWRRMANDFNKLTAEALKKLAPWTDGSQILYAGHSKGAYVALMAAGAPTASMVKPQSLLLFAPAGYDSDYLARMDSRLPLTVVWGEKDTIISRASVREIFDRSPSSRKQFIEVKSYAETQPNLAADHMFVLTKSTFFGGPNGPTALHYFGSWKWILGAVWDLQSGAKAQNPYLYGDQADSTGLPEFKHSVNRNW
jgi:dienelactone hydrolase